MRVYILTHLRIVVTRICAVYPDAGLEGRLQCKVSVRR